MWKNVNANVNQIKTETERAVLINCPHNSKYDGYSYWHPSKLVREGRHSASISIGYTDEFKFKLVKYGKGEWNSRDIIDEIEISVEEFEEMYEVTNTNIRARKTVDEYETHKPKEIKELKNNLEEELKDD